MENKEQDQFEKFHLIATMFKGYSSYGEGKGGSYTYEITINRSVVHTGRFDYMIEGLNAGLEKEKEQLAKLKVILDKLSPEDREILFKS